MTTGSPECATLIPPVRVVFFFGWEPIDAVDGDTTKKPLPDSAPRILVYLSARILTMAFRVCLYRLAAGQRVPHWRQRYLDAIGGPRPHGTLPSRISTSPSPISTVRVRDTFQNAIRTLHEAGVPEAHLSALHLMAKVHSVLPFCPLIFKLQSSSPGHAFQHWAPPEIYLLSWRATPHMCSL